MKKQIKLLPLFLPLLLSLNASADIELSPGDSIFLGGNRVSCGQSVYVPVPAVTVRSQVQIEGSSFIISRNGMENCQRYASIFAQLTSAEVTTQFQCKPTVAGNPDKAFMIATITGQRGITIKATPVTISLVYDNMDWCQGAMSALSQLSNASVAVIASCSEGPADRTGMRGNIAVLSASITIR